MRNNRLLGVAIAATLSLPVGVAHAATTGFQNVGSSIADEPTAGITSDKILTGAIGARKIGSTSFDDLFQTEVVDVPSGGITYAIDVLGGDASAKLPKSKKAAVLYTISTGSAIDKELLVTFTLSEGVFAETPTLRISDKDDPAVADDTIVATDIVYLTGGTGLSFVNFRVSASNPDKTLGNKKLENEDQLLLVYQFKDAPSLKAADGKVEMTATLADDTDTSTPKGPLNPERTVTIATSGQALTAALKSEAGGTIFLSTQEDSKKFRGSGGAYLGPTSARIGFLTIKNEANFKQSDGEKDFSVGDSTGDGKLKTGTKLEITSGQFSASTGKVSLYYGTANPTTIKTANVTKTGENYTATFDLGDTELKNIRDNANGKDVEIRMGVDGTTVINTVENPPQATLTLDFEQEYVTDITAGPTSMRQIGQDGMTCTVYNVPHKGNPDVPNIRITNESSTPGKLTAKMYDQDGKSIGDSAGRPLNGGNAVGVGETIHVNSTKLVDEVGFPDWEGRAMLEIIATLPKIEVLLLMRNIAPGAPPTNLSTGATGDACDI
jgi:hypothetical protein